MDVLSIEDLNVDGKKVQMRVDFNVPLDEQGNITEDTRIQAALPSIRYVLEKGGALILMSHLGRPKGKKSPEMSLSPCARYLSKILKKPVQIAPDCIGNETKLLASHLKKGEILLLENLRFHEAEEHPEKDPQFAVKLAELGDLYVNDAFGTSHRPHSSIVGVAKQFPGKAAAGYLLKKEIDYLGKTFSQPKRPFCALIGGAKISTKIGVLESLIEKVDTLMVGGGMVYTFFKAQGIPIGDSIYEEQCIDVARSILKHAQEKQIKLLLSEDVMVADAFQNQAKTKVVEKHQGIPNGYQGMDIGPKTVELFSKELKKAKTIFWNGPVGVFEMSNFAKGTKAIAKTLESIDATIVVGGGDSIAALRTMGLTDAVTHISTGGGASLEYIEKGTLPGIEALSKDTERYKNGGKASR